MQNKINLGIIGKNFGYNVIYKSFLKNKNYKIIGFSFKSEKFEKIKIPKGIKIYSNWKNLILDKKIDAIAIAVPPILHKNILKFAIKNNKNIFCEKPLTSSFKEASLICNLIKKKKISHMVNYEFANIDAFNFFKRKISHNIKINKIYLNWFINMNKRPDNSWKENHSKGGGIFFNYICHAIYYMEFLFGKIICVNTNTLLKKEANIKTLKGKVIFKNGLSAKLDIRVGSIKHKITPIHQLKILSEEKNYVLETKLNSLSDQFKLVAFDKKFNKKMKILYKSRKNKDDFRIKPTLKNSKRFCNWILKGKIQTPNFFVARRIYLIINKMILSSKMGGEIYI
jgi:predicted dehydrogenase